MLKKISCDKFKTQPSEFRTGLNVVLGSSNGSNAIGKTTFLLLIDFAFGGDDYPKRAKDVVGNIGHHTVDFTFEFDGKLQYFSRSTNSPTKVNRCDSKGNIIDEMTSARYRDYLRREYKILLPSISFKEMTERFFRIYGRGNRNEHKPLQDDGESMATSVDNLMKLLDKYEPLENLKTAEENLGIRSSSQIDKTVTELSASISENNDMIDALEKRREKLNRQNEEADLRVLGVDSKKAEQLAEIKKELDKLYRRRNRLQSQLNAVRNNIPDNKGALRKDFQALLYFFPEANIAAMDDVEAFHAKINGFLQADIEQEIARLEPLIVYADAEISTLEKQIIDSGIARSLSQSILTQYASVSREIEKLADANKELERQKEQLGIRKDNEKLIANLKRLQEEALQDAEITVNMKMEEINTEITGRNRPAPVLILNPDKTFEFETPNDKSQGTALKGLVIYDLTMLDLTPIPALIHDSSIVKGIEDIDFERILALYQGGSTKGKQVFLAYDKADATTPKAYQELKAHTVLRLSVGNELFGTSWSRNEEALELKEEAPNTDTDKDSE